MEILVRRLLFDLVNVNHTDWYRNLDDGIEILEPPPTTAATVDVLARPEKLFPIVLGAVQPRNGATPADLFVATHDNDSIPAVRACVNAVAEGIPCAIPLLIPTPELEAWLTSKRAVERAYDREHCTVPEPNIDLLKADAKAELQRLLATFGQKPSSAKLATMAALIASDELQAREDWSGWKAARDTLKSVLPPPFTPSL